MLNIGWFSRRSKQQPSSAGAQRILAGLGVAVLVFTTGITHAQNPTPGTQTATSETQMSIPNGYSSHTSVDLGGRIANIDGSGDMYGTLVNMHSGPRVQGQTFTLRALPGNKKAPFDNLSASTSGFGGDPYNFAKLDAYKGKFYEFTGIFRRDRLYSNYDLLGNPNIPGGMTINNVVAGKATPALAWPQINESPVKFNIVRRMTDTSLTLYPLSAFTYRLGYSHSTMEGPTLSPSYTIMKYNALLRQYERNGNDDFMGAIDWKPRADTKISFEMQGNHYKSDTFFTLDPNGFLVQEADGTPAYLGNYTSFLPYGAVASGAPLAGICTTTSMGGGFTDANNYTIVSPATKPGGLPIINPACAVVTSYLRSSPIRIWTPTETLRVQSSAFKNVSINGNVNYTLANMDMPNYYESAQGLNGAVRSVIWSGGYARAHRAVIGSDFGIVWQATPTVDLADQVTYSSVQEPGYSNIPRQGTLSTPLDTKTSTGNETINYSGPLTPGLGSLPHGINGTLTANYYGQEYVINNATVSWDATQRARFALTYRYSNRNIGQGIPHAGPIPIVVSDPVSGTIAITENAGIFNAALRPTKDWELNGTVEIGYADNAFTAVGQRQFKTFRVHTLYRPKSWATISGSYSDRERHNNTNNNQDVVAAGDANYNGPLNHVDYNRIGSMAVVLAPNERYSVSANYSYSDVYAATNICYSSGATATAPGAAQVTSGGTPALCAGNATWLARDFMDAPTQIGSATLAFSPSDKVKTSLGYSVSAVNGSRFFNDPRDVNGSMVSTYQSPVVGIAYTMHPGLVWKADYNFYGYGEGGISGSALCSTTTSATATIVPCNSSTLPANSTALLMGGSAGATLPRNFRANNVTLGVHYEF
jgi:hypothetical protein